MGSSKRHQRSLKAPPQMRRTTRSSKGRLLSDPTENTQQLTSQLRQLGLYAADTLGDGNCLFRALSDQLYGTEGYHLQLRRDICDWIEKHKTRYEPFVEDERGLDVHLQLMRQPATYGGHLELSAFAHMARRDVKVIQPGLVYVIEWASGWEPAPPDVDASTPSSSSPPIPDEALDDRLRRPTRRERKRAEKDKLPPPPPTDDSDDESTGTVYVAYHDWEHFSSIRNLRGPHAGPPKVRETLVSNVNDLPLPSSKPKSTSKSKPPSKASSRAASKPLSAIRSRPDLEPALSAPPTPSQIPLPPSRSISPAPTLGLPSLALSSASPSPSAPSADALPRMRDQRSPKRTFDESSGSSEATTSESAHKRSKHTDADGDVDMTADALTDLDTDDDDDDDEDEGAGDPDEDTPALSESASTASSTSSPSPPPAERPLTRRQRKALGLPKPRPALAGQRSAGKIVIPGGRFRRGAVRKQEELREEWTRNGVGRMDVRGFRELRI